MFKGEVLAGEQPAIVDRGLFDAVQVKLSEQLNNHKTTRMKSEAFRQEHEAKILPTL